MAQGDVTNRTKNIGPEAIYFFGRQFAGTGQIEKKDMIEVIPKMITVDKKNDEKNVDIGGSEGSYYLAKQ